MSLTRFIPFTCLFLIAACSYRAEESFTPWRLPVAPVEAVQLLKGTYDDNQFVFQVALSLNEERLSLIGLDSMGRRAFSLIWNEDGVVSEKAAWMPDALTAEHVLKDIMLAYWPLDALAHWQIEEDGQKRYLNRDDERVASVTKLAIQNRWDGRLLIENHVRKYRIEVQSHVNRGAQ